MKSYIVPELEIRMFSDDDVITASSPDPTRETSKPIELPFIPADINF